MPLTKRPTALPTMTVEFSDGPLAGHTFIMHEPPSSLVFSDQDVLERELALAAIAAVVDHTLDLPDLGTIPTRWATALGDGWVAAWREAILPPVTGRPSQRRSPKQG